MQIQNLYLKIFFILIATINISLKTPTKSHFEDVKAITYFLSKEDFKKEILDKLEQENSILYLMSHYNERDFKRDVIEISMYYVEGKQPQMKPVDKIGKLKNPKNFNNVIFQSTYMISKSELQEIYDKFESDPLFKNFVIKPDYYKEDSRFLSYDIYPADAKWRKLETANALAEKTRLDPSPPAISN